MIAAIPLCGITEAKAQSYTYTTIPSPGTVYAWPKINNVGQIVFTAYGSSCGSCVVLSDGSQTQVIAAYSDATSLFISDTAINNAGDVAYIVCCGASSQQKYSYYLIKSGQTSLLFKSAQYPDSFGLFLADDDTVSFASALGEVIYHSTPTGIHRVFPKLAAVNGNSNMVGSWLGNASNGLGAVAAEGSDTTGGFYGIYALNFDTNTSKLLVKLRSGLPYAPAASSSGAVVYEVNGPAAQPNNNIIYLIPSGGRPTRVATLAGNTSFADGFAINANNQFVGTLTLADGSQGGVLLNGSKATPVLARGTVIEGESIYSAYASNWSINDAGQVAMLAVPYAGGQLVVLANPAP